MQRSQWMHHHVSNVLCLPRHDSMHCYLTPSDLLAIHMYIMQTMLSDIRYCAGSNQSHLLYDISTRMHAIPRTVIASGESYLAGSSMQRCQSGGITSVTACDTLHLTKLCILSCIQQLAFLSRVYTYEFGDSVTSFPTRSVHISPISTFQRTYFLAVCREPAMCHTKE